MVDPGNRSFSETELEIMRATYRALAEHGYADLTMQRIAAEYGKSTAAIHYHYDTKDDLLSAFLEYLLAQFVDSIHGIETIDSRDRLDTLLDTLLVEAGEHHDLLRAILEMRSQAPYNETFRTQFRENDEYVHYTLKAVINHGIDEGEFEDVDADHVARALLTIIDGGRTRAVVFEEDDALETARNVAAEYVAATLL